MSYQRNYGVKIAQHDFLLFLDADILFDNRLLNNLLQDVLSNKLDVASTQMIPYPSEFVEKIYFYVINLFFKIFQYIKPLSFGACLFVRKEIFSSVGGFDTRLRYAEDLDLLKRLNKQKRKFKIVNIKAYFSIRRFQKCGTKKMIYTYTKTFFEYVFSDTITVPKEYAGFNEDRHT